MTDAPDSNDDPVDEYATHADQLSWVTDDLRVRRELVSAAIRSAFADYLEVHSTEWVVFGRITADRLAQIFVSYPVLVKPILALCNIANRAVKRDLGFELQTYRPKLDAIKAAELAGYVKPFLPNAVALPVLQATDDWWFIDKSIRAQKGRWEQGVKDALTARTGRTFKKRKFVIEGEEFELDAAYPATGTPIEVGVDVKQIGHRRDIHKRGDEIVNKAAKFKRAYPSGHFGSVVYYPFDATEQGNIRSRLNTPNIDGLVFASDSKASVENAVMLLAPQLGPDVIDPSPPATVQEELGLTDD